MTKPKAYFAQASKSVGFELDFIKREGGLFEEQAALRHLDHHRARVVAP